MSPFCNTAEGDMKSEGHKNGRRWLQYVIPLLAVAAFVGFNRYMLGSLIICPFRAITSLPCPGCGLTHAGMALLKLDVKASLNFHALFLPVAFTLFIIFFPSGIFKAIDWMKRQYWWYALLLVALMTYYGWRLYYCYPGDYPMYRLTRCYLSKLGIIKPLTVAERYNAIVRKKKQKGNK